MPSQDDMELLQEYASRGSEEAFAALVSRHVSMVYSVAFRRLGNQHDAQEVTQAVFIILARKSKSVKRETLLSGWLFHTARLTAANFLRSKIRRARREQGAYMQASLLGAEQSSWKQIAPFLDDAIANLNEKDRNAVVLRFIQGRSLKEVGATLGWSEDAAKKRVSRAVEKLRHFFEKRGMAVSGEVLTGGITTYSIEPAPEGLASVITASVLKGALLNTSSTTLVNGTLKFMAWTKAKIAVTAGVAAIVTAQFYEVANQHKELAALRQKLSTQKAPLGVESAEMGRSEVEQLRAENGNLSNQVMALQQKLAMTTSAETASLMKPETTASQNVDAISPGRELGLAVASGEPKAFEKLRAMANAELRSFNAKEIGMNDTERGDFALETFAPLQAAFDALTEEAGKGNPTALKAISDAVLVPELQGHAVGAAGVLAGNGDEAALQLLLNPAQYQILLASTVGALKPAADSGNQKAIDALAAVAANPKDQALWFMAADGLGNAAAAGNSTAVDALIGLSTVSDQSVRRVVMTGLRQASANQSAAATKALQQMSIQ